MNRQEIIEALKANTDPAPLFSEADSVRRRYCGEKVHLRGLVEFSNYCRRNCLYCGIRAGNSKISRYRMTEQEILSCTLNAVKLRYPSVVLQSGEDPAWNPKKLAALVEQIKKQTGLAVTLSVGEHSREDYKMLRSAGADRFLLRFETSDRSMFSSLKPDSDYNIRFRCLAWLKEAGFQTGSGIMTGLPGQTFESLADDILLFKTLELDMVGIGPFIANPDTPLAGANSGQLELALKVMAITRILTRRTHIPATTAMGTIEPKGREKALCAGANVLMPNLSPRQYRKNYSLYPNKICVNEAPEKCSACVDAMLLKLGRRRASGPGHAISMNTEA